MCWSPEASVAVASIGAVATVVAARRGAPAAIWGTLAYFSAMEGLQVAGYAVIDQCGTRANEAVTLLSYLHIAFQPLVINLFALNLVPAPVRTRVSVWVLGLSALTVAVMLLQILPLADLGRCLPGAPLCGEALCTKSGNWHIAWAIPYNGLFVPIESFLGTNFGFPAYMLCVFALPLAYGAWRFVALHLLAGPVLARLITDNPNEMPAVWCLFSIAILCIGLSSFVRQAVSARNWYGMRFPDRVPP
jgi:hypothetical protein